MARFPSFAHSIARQNAMLKPNLRSRRARRLERKQGTRPSYPLVLIVCEGEKTEPAYFEEIRQKWRIPALNWVILPSELGTGPEKVVEYAELKARQEGRWEEVYCVFDRDDHLHYTNAILKAQSINGKIKTKGKESVTIRFAAIPSDPCFELWFLIHFQPITREEHRDEILRLLKSCVSGYSKGCRGMFNRTVADFEKACEHAELLRKRKMQTGNSNPSTDVDILVKRLNDIGKMNPYFRASS
jgi:hypothetical protein